MAYFPKPVGGAEVAIKEITDRILPTDIEFHLVCLRFDSLVPEEEQVGNVLVHRIGFTRPGAEGALLATPLMRLNKLLYEWRAYKTACALHQKYHYDGLWAMMAHSSGIPGALFARRYPQVAYVQTLQEGDPPERIERMMYPVWPLFMRAFTTPTVIQTISTFLAAWARRRGAVCPIEVVPNGVATARFSRDLSNEELSQARAKLNRQPDDTLLITTSRLVRKNGIDLVIRALAELPASVRFAVLGTGPDGEELRALAAAVGVAQRTLFLGQVSHAELPALLKASDIFIRPSRSEGMGNSFIEAMAAGIPVIATQEGGIADFLFDARKNPDHEATGWAVATESVEGIVEAVRDIMGHPDTVRAVTASARALALAQYDWDLVAHAMRERVFAHVVGAKT